jgi:hypothetical protein
MKNIIVVLLVVLFTGCNNIQNSSDSDTVESQIKPESQSTLPQSIYGTYRNNTGEIEVSVSKTTWSSTLYFKNSDGVVYHEVRSNGKVIENELYPIDYIPNISPKLGSFDGKSLRYMYREGDVVICDKVK